MVKCEVAKRTLKLYSWVPSLLQVCSSLKDCVAIVISSQRREIFSSHVAENARSLAPLEMTSMGHSCIATQSLTGESLILSSWDNFGRNVVFVIPIS